MADRVKSLRYRFRSRRQHDRFDKAAPVSARLGAFDIELRDGSLAATPLRNYEQVRDARDALEPSLHDWEVRAGLDGHDVDFIFESGTVEAESPTGQKVIAMTALVRQVGRYNAGAHTTYRLTMADLPS